MAGKSKLRELRLNLIRIRDGKLCTHVTIGTLSGDLRIENERVKEIVLDAVLKEAIKQIDEDEKNSNVAK